MLPFLVLSILSSHVSFPYCFSLSCSVLPCLIIFCLLYFVLFLLSFCVLIFLVLMTPLCPLLTGALVSLPHCPFCPVFVSCSLCPVLSPFNKEATESVTSVVSSSSCCGLSHFYHPVSSCLVLSCVVCHFLIVHQYLLFFCPIILSSCCLTVLSSPSYSVSAACVFVVLCCNHLFICQELVRLAAERQDGPAPLSPVQSQPAMGQMGGFDDQQASDWTVTCQSPGAPAEEEEEGVRMERKGEEQTVSAPPKPPMASPEPLPQESPPQGLR